MKYSLFPANNKKQRNEFIINNFEFYTFWSSREWGEFQKLEWHDVIRYGIIDSNKERIGCIQLVKIEAKRGCFFLSQHWPFIKDHYFKVFDWILPQLKKLAKKNGVAFLRVNWLTHNTKANFEGYKNIWFRFAPLHVSAEETHLLDLWPTEDELKAWMRKTTRYMINRATKEWVEIKPSNSNERIEAFIKLHHKHSSRTNWKRQYHAFTSKYIHNLFKSFDETQIHLFDAVYDGVVEATAITIEFWKNAAYYLWASDIKNPKFSPAYLAQRAWVTHAKESGCSKYNFRWVAPDKNKKHPLHWVSLFKRWFWGEDYFLTHAHDYAFSRKYWVTFVIETIRRFKRGYYYIKPKS